MGVAPYKEAGLNTLVDKLARLGLVFLSGPWGAGERPAVFSTDTELDLEMLAKEVLLLEILGM